MGKTRSFNQFETQESRHRKQAPQKYHAQDTRHIIHKNTMLNIECGGGPRYGARASLDITMDASVQSTRLLLDSVMYHYFPDDRNHYSYFDSLLQPGDPLAGTMYDPQLCSLHYYRSAPFACIYLASSFYRCIFAHRRIESSCFTKLTEKKKTESIATITYQFR